MSSISGIHNPSVTVLFGHAVFFEGIGICFFALRYAGGHQRSGLFRLQLSGLCRFRLIARTSCGVSYGQLFITLYNGDNRKGGNEK